MRSVNRPRALPRQSLSQQLPRFSDLFLSLSLFHSGLFGTPYSGPGRFMRSTSTSWLKLPKPTTNAMKRCFGLSLSSVRLHFSLSLSDTGLRVQQGERQRWRQCEFPRQVCMLPTLLIIMFSPAQIPLTILPIISLKSPSSATNLRKNPTQNQCSFCTVINHRATRIWFKVEHVSRVRRSLLA
jgi:hypothetical protein